MRGRGGVRKATTSAALCLVLVNNEKKRRMWLLFAERPIQIYQLKSDSSGSSKTTYRGTIGHGLVKDLGVNLEGLSVLERDAYSFEGEQVPIGSTGSKRNLNERLSESNGNVTIG